MKNVLIVFLIFLNSVINGLNPSKLSGGRVDSVHKFPFHAAVQYIERRICAGSIIGINHIITSASCVVLEKTNHHVVTMSNLKVLVGTNDEFNTFGYGKLYNVKYIIWHDDYNPGMFWRNDIAILRLETSIELSNTCSKINLPIKHIFFNSIMTIANWEENLYSINNKFLKYFEIKVLVQRDCANKFPHFTFDFRIQNCAKIHCDTHNNCAFTSGDSGAGIIFNKKIVGIASVFRPDKPKTLIFTKVLPYMDFIHTVLRKY